MLRDQETISYNVYAAKLLVKTVPNVLGISPSIIETIYILDIHIKLQS
jgi:hypothetical protein